MQRERRPLDPSERLVYFTDAAVAISLTLLVLPLVDLVPEARRASPRVGVLVREHLAELGAFVLSFAVVFRFWWGHHRLFRHVSHVSPALVTWNAIWMFSVVVLPVPTAIITAYPHSPGTVALYTGTLVLTSGSLMMLAVTAHRDPRTTTDRRPETREDVLGIAVLLGLQLLALVVGTVFSAVNYWALTLMFLAGPVEHLVKRSWARRSAAGSGPDPTAHRG